MTKRDEYIEASFNRIMEIAKNLDMEVPGLLATAINVELRTMYDAGSENTINVYDRIVR